MKVKKAVKKMDLEKINMISPIQETPAFNKLETNVKVRGVS